MSKSRVTVKELARLAGVSIGTVDRVLHGRGGVSEGTRSRILSLVESRGYKPNVLARQLSLGKTWSFTVLLPRADQDSGYWSLCLEGINAAARDLAAYSTHVEIVQFDRSDPEAYRRLLDGIIQAPGDGILVAPVLPAILREALDRLPPGFPYAFFDGSLEGCSPIFSIGQDAFAAGLLAGRLLSLLCPGEGPLAVIAAHPEDRHIRARAAGFASWFEKGGTVTAGSGTVTERQVLLCDCPRFDRPEECGKWLELLFREEPELRGILVASASGHLAGDWLAARGRKAGVALLSWDLVPHNLRALREGILDCVISQRPAEQGREGLERLYKALVHGQPGGAEMVSSEIFLKENLPPEAASTARGEG